MASVHDKLARVRKPRVHITYQVETEGAEVQRELPFVVGVMGDFAGDPTEPLLELEPTLLEFLSFRNEGIIREEIAEAE